MDAPASQSSDARARPSREELRRLMTSVMERSNEPSSAGGPPHDGAARGSATGRKWVIAVAVVTLPALGYLASTFGSRSAAEKEPGVAAVSVPQAALPSNAPATAGSLLDASGHLSASRRATVS